MHVEDPVLNAQEGDAILELEDGSIQVVKARTVTTLQFPALPQGLVTKPTLVWRIECAKPGQHQAVLSYLTGGMRSDSWVPCCRSIRVEWSLVGVGRPSSRWFMVGKR